MKRHQWAAIASNFGPLPEDPPRSSRDVTKSKGIKTVKLRQDHRSIDPWRSNPLTALVVSLTSSPALNVLLISSFQPRMNVGCTLRRSSFAPMGYRMPCLSNTRPSRPSQKDQDPSVLEGHAWPLSCVSRRSKDFHRRSCPSISGMIKGCKDSESLLALLLFRGVFILSLLQIIKVRSVFLLRACRLLVVATSPNTFLATSTRF